MGQNIVKMFETQNGYLQSKQLTNRNAYYQLKKILDIGEIEMVKRGLYKLTNFGNNSDLTDVCRTIPNGVLCLFSAWHFYALTTYVPSEYHIAIPSKSKIVLQPYPPIKLYYWSSVAFNLGKTNIDTINIYDIEKSVCDAIKFRNKVGIDIAIEILKNYLKRKDKNIDQLLKYAKILRIENSLNQYLNIML